MKDKISILYEEDICQVEVDAIVCEANLELEPEAEITKKIMEKAGEELLKQCNKFSDLKKGDAILTEIPNQKLQANYLIHAILCNLGEEAEEEDMMGAIRNALSLAKEKGFKTIAMPLIGAKAKAEASSKRANAGIPIKRAAELMLAEAKRHLEMETSLEKIFFVLQDHVAYDAFEEGFRQL